MTTINNKSERNDGRKCLGWPGTSYGPASVSGPSDLNRRVCDLPHSVSAKISGTFRKGLKKYGVIEQKIALREKIFGIKQNRRHVFVVKVPNY